MNLGHKYSILLQWESGGVRHEVQLPLEQGVERLYHLAHQMVMSLGRDCNGIYAAIQWESIEVKTE
jgi:hypothetical protein